MHSLIKASIVVSFLVAESAQATTVLRQIVTTTRKGTSRDQATVTYLDGERFRVERYPDKEVKGDWSNLVLFDGKQTYNCRRTSKAGSQNTCRATTGGPLSELDAFLGTPGMKFSVESFSFTSEGATKTVAGQKCQPHKLSMQIGAVLDVGMKLPAGLVPALKGSITGTSCVATLADWNPTALAKQLETAKNLFTNPAAYDAFIIAAKAGAGFELEGETKVSADMGGGTASLPELNSTAKKTTQEVKTKQPPLTKEQLQIPAGFTVVSKAK